jgi:dGTPase
MPTQNRYFFSEQQILERVAEKTGTSEKRHPITFLVEAADDIVYSVVDIEDGIKKRILNWEQVKQYLDARCSGSAVFDEAMQRTHDQLKSSPPSDASWAQAFRVNAISGTVRAAVHTFEHRYDEIMSGNYGEELVRDQHYEGASLIKGCKELLVTTVFREDDILRLEVRGRRVLHDLLDLFWEGVSDFLHRREETTKTYAGKLYLLIAGSYRGLFERRIEAAPNDAVYAALQLVTDYVSGMTDGYACRLHKDLMNG